MTSRTSLLVSVLLMLAAASAVFGGMLATGIITFAGPTATGAPIAQPTVAPSPPASAQPSLEPSPTVLPSPTEEPPPTGEPTNGPQPTAGGTYVVQPNDSLSTIGEKFGVAWPLIAQANGIEGPDYRIQIGQELIIPAPDANASPDPEAQFYIVQPGDTLTDIAYRLGVSTALLADVNGLDNWDEIYEGQRLTVPGQEPAESPSPEP